MALYATATSRNPYDGADHHQHEEFNLIDAQYLFSENTVWIVREIEGEPAQWQHAIRWPRFLVLWREAIFEVVWNHSSIDQARMERTRAYDAFLAAAIAARVEVQSRRLPITPEAHIYLRGIPQNNSVRIRLEAIAEADWLSAADPADDAELERLVAIARAHPGPIPIDHPTDVTPPRLNVREENADDVRNINTVFAALPASALVITGWTTEAGVAWSSAQTTSATLTAEAIADGDWQAETAIEARVAGIADQDATTATRRIILFAGSILFLRAVDAAGNTTYARIVNTGS